MVSSMSTSALDRASQRAKERAEARASRAAAVGMKLPTRKKINGWAILKEKMRDHTLLPALRAGAGGYNLGRRRTSAAAANAARKQSMYSLRTHMAEVAYQVSSRTSIGGGRANAKMAAEHAKVAQQMQKNKRLERMDRRKLIKKQKKLERELEYLNFPTILGWYFDGFFSPYFQLNEEHAAIFNQMELEISKNKENSIKETFAEKAKRYFWPPVILGGYCFRTRGIYLDFKEIMRDPPHTPPEVILDKRVEAVTLFVSENMDENESRIPSDEEHHLPGEETTSVAAMTAEEERIRKLMKDIDDDPNLTPEEKAAKKKALLFALKKKRQKNALQQRIAEEMHFKAINKNDFYFDDQKPGFFKKKAADRDKYYYDSKWNVWRIKRSIVHFPNDYYWDETLAMFFPKDRTRLPDYYLYDPSLGAYRVAGEPMLPNWKGIKPIHFFFDHKIGKWVKKAKARPGVDPVFDSNGNRFCTHKKFDTPDDFHFDATTLKFQKKNPGEKYIYDAIIGAWRVLDSKVPEKDQKKPIDFYWNEDEHTFKKKDAPSSFFAWDGNNKFFRKKKSLHGKYHPKNWYWFDKEKSWKFKRTTSRTDLASQSLNWRPDRDYDKPWLEYIGGFQDYHLDYDYDSDEDDVPPKTAASGGKILDRTATERNKGKIAEPTESGKREKKLQFSASEPTLKSRGGGGKDGESGSELVPGSSYKDMQGTGTSKEPEKPEVIAYIDTIDRKTLKATNLGKMVNDTDLRKYFASVKKIVRPKVPGTDEDEEYAYLKFKTDEAAAAALKTMHNQLIRGQTIKLSYKLKAEDETEGGHADTAEQPSMF